MTLESQIKQNGNPSRFNQTKTRSSVGDTTISGKFDGNSTRNNGLLMFTGSIDFRLDDEFRDPLDIGSVLKEPYAKIDELIADAVSTAIAYISDLASRMAEVARDSADSITSKLGITDQRIKNCKYN